MEAVITVKDGQLHINTDVQNNNNKYKTNKKQNKQTKNTRISKMVNLQERAKIYFASFVPIPSELSY